MKLDPRIKSLSDILTGRVTDIERGKQFIGGAGYFANELTDFRNLENCLHGVLVGSDAYLGDYPYTWHLGGRYENFAFFIPAGSLEPIKGKKYRPYTPEEFCDKFQIGQPIKFRNKGDEGSAQYGDLQGLWYKQRDGKMIAYAIIESSGYALDELFNDFEWRGLFKKDFEPFGVEVEE